MQSPSYLVRIQLALSKFGLVNGTMPPQDTTKAANTTGTTLALAFMWKQVAKYADGKYKTIMAELALETPDEEGEHNLCDSQHFVCTAKVSAPVKRFDAVALATKLNKSKYKVPLAVATEMIEQAKLPTKGTVTITIAERVA